MPQPNQHTKHDPPEPRQVEIAADNIRRIIASINEEERGYYFKRFLAGNITDRDLNAMIAATSYLNAALERLIANRIYGAATEQPKKK
jgi:hypothetical protein